MKKSKYVAHHTMADRIPIEPLVLDDDAPQPPAHKNAPKLLSRPFGLDNCDVEYPDGKRESIPWWRYVWEVKNGRCPEDKRLIPCGPYRNGGPTTLRMVNKPTPPDKHAQGPRGTKRLGTTYKTGTTAADKKSAAKVKK